MSSGITVREFAGSPESWDANVGERGSIFHRSSWLSLLETQQSAQLLRLELIRDGQTIGVAPVFTRRFFPLTVAASPMVVEDSPYMGIVCDTTDLPNAVAALRSHLWRRGVHFLRLMQREEFNPTETFDACTVISKHTHVLDISQSEDAIWKGFEGRCRTAVRKAEKSGVTVSEETDATSLDAYYDILNELYTKQGMATPNRRSFYQEMFNSFAPRQLFVLAARVESTLVAGAILLQDGTNVYYLNGCSLGQYNELSPNNLVQWQAIRTAKVRGATHYDFVGSDIERLAKFKKSFGGDLVTYTLIESSRNSVVAAIRKRFPQMKQTIGRLLQKRS